MSISAASRGVSSEIGEQTKILIEAIAKIGDRLIVLLRPTTIFTDALITA